MSRLIDNIKRLAEIVKNETKSGANTAVRIGGLFGEIAAELERKYDKTESDEQMREHNTNAEAHQNIQDRIDGVLGELSENKLDKTGDGKDVVVSFQEVTDRVNVESGDSLSVLAGKVRKWFAGLQAVAFSGRTEDLVSDADHRLTTDVEKARWNDTYTKQETDNKDSAVLDAAKKYVMDRISDVISGSPAALDTLYEIANALNNDPHFATTIMALINGKADTAHTHTKAQITDFPTSMPASDVYAWAKAASKPSYTASEVGAASAGHNHDAAYQPKGSYAAANHTHDYAAKTHTHTADQISDTTTKVMMTKAERSKLAGLEGSPKCKIIKVTSSHTYSVNTEDAKLNKLIFIFSGTISDMNFNINNQQMLTDGTEVLFINSSDRCNIYLKICVISDSNYKVGGGCICTAYKITPYPSVSRYLLQSSWNDTAW